MKILEVAGSGYFGTDQMGPVTSTVFNLSYQFLNRGHDVTVVDVRAQAPRNRLPSGIRVIEAAGLPQPLLAHRGGQALPARTARRLTLKWKKLFNQAVLLRSVGERVRLNDFDIVHVHDPHAAMLMPSILGVRPIYTSHTPTWARQWGGRRFSQIVWRKLHAHRIHELHAIRNARTTVALGNYLKEILPEYPIVTIPNGTDWKLRQIKRSDAREALGYGHDDFVVYFVGRISPIKDLDTLFDAVLMAALPKLKLKVIGSLSDGFNHKGGSPSSYAERIAERARAIPSADMLGFINNRSDAFALHLSAADVLVIPSRFEGQSSAALEGLSFEIPIIATNVGGLGQLVPPSVGRLVPPGNPKAIAHELRCLAHDPHIREAMRANSRKHLARHFTWPISASRYLQLFDTLTWDPAHDPFHDISAETHSIA